MLLPGPAPASRLPGKPARTLPIAPVFHRLPQGDLRLLALKPLEILRMAQLPLEPGELTSKV